MKEKFTLQNYNGTFLEKARNGENSIVYDGNNTFLAAAENSHRSVQRALK